MSPVLPPENISLLLVTRVSGLEEELGNRALPGVEVTRSKSDDGTAELIPGAEIILADPVLVASHLDQAENLHWYQSTAAGVEPVFLLSRRRDYRFTRITGLFGASMAEYILLHILSRERYLLNLAAQQQRREWRVERYRRLGDLTLGIMGLGSIGGQIAGIARSLGIQVWGLRRGGELVAGIDKTFSTDRLDEFLSGSDYIVNVLPSTPATVGLLSGDRLRACRPGAILINIGRGDIIDEVDLITALNEGWIAGAVLDVFEQEPLPENSPLWDQPGVTITPHVAALGMATDIVNLFIANLERYRAGQQLQHLVDWERGY